MRGSVGIQNTSVSSARFDQAPVIRRRIVTLKQLSDALGRTENAVRMLEKRGAIQRIPTKERKVMFDLFEAFKSLGLESALIEY